MPTLGEVRARLRRALEDTDATAPLWPDTELNEALATAHREYGARFPREATATLAAVVGQTDYALPADAPGRRAAGRRGARGGPARVRPGARALPPGAQRRVRGIAAPPAPRFRGEDEGGALTPNSSPNSGRGEQTGRVWGRRIVAEVGG